MVLLALDGFSLWLWPHAVTTTTPARQRPPRLRRKRQRLRRKTDGRHNGDDHGCGRATPFDAPGFCTWEEVLAAADGTTVNWFMWGGSDTINSNVDNDIGDVIKEQFNITLNRVPADAADFVNKVLGRIGRRRDRGRHHRSHVDQR